MEFKEENLKMVKISEPADQQKIEIAGETEKKNIYRQWFLDCFIIILGIVICFLVLKYLFGPVLGLEHEVWARVLQADESKDGYVLVDYVYEDRIYKKSIRDRDELKPGEVVNLQFFGRNPQKADWYSHKGGHGPYTPMAIFLFFLQIFAFTPSIVLWNRYFEGRTPLPLITLLNYFSIFKNWLKRKTDPTVLGIIYALMIVLFVVLVGFTGQTLCGVYSDPRNTSKDLSDAYLSAVLHGNINTACTFVCPEQRYDFLTNIHRWELKEYKIVSDDTKQVDDLEYYSNYSKRITISSSNPSLYHVVYEHKSSFDNKPMQGQAVIGLIYHLDWFYVKTGYLPNNSN